MATRIAITGMACCYPGADSPEQLWDNVLAQRQAFRRLPPERLCLEDYWSEDRAAPDRTYATLAALIEGYTFDRVEFRVAGSTYRSADPAHWLALDVAARALADSGFAAGNGLPRPSTGVIVGNTLTGEVVRANLMRLRWPYVERVLDAQLVAQGWSPDQRGRLLAAVERSYKAPFPETGEESLAGGLSNTIAGRICNHFDLGGGGYTVDGACAASLLAIITACNSLVAGDVDVAIAGGVDLSLDPFELVGFAKAGALAGEQMRIYDRRSAGFWPGEGCGFLVLMRVEDAVAAGHRVYATIAGWGVSSDGSGGITRPDVAGQLLALERAYRRAGCDPAAVALFEGHGTGTAVGDRTELVALNQARRLGGSGTAERAAIGSIKTNIGHTKAAAGVAGTIKAATGLHRQVIPPTTGCEEPHAELTRSDATLRRVDEAEPWPTTMPLRVGVSAMGFGGINTHLVLEGDSSVARRRTLSARERALSSSPQDAELLVLAAGSKTQLAAAARELAATMSGLSFAELADLAGGLAAREQRGALRAAVVARTPIQCEQRLRTLATLVEQGAERHIDPARGIFLGAPSGPPAVAYLFPGQASPASKTGGCWSRRFDGVRALYAAADLPPERSVGDTEAAQPAVALASLAGLDVLGRLGVEADRAAGHSLGELTALHWAGALDRDGLLGLVRARGRIIGALPGEGGMVSVQADVAALSPLLDGLELAVSGINAPGQTTVSGRQPAVDRLLERAASHGIAAVRLAVSHAFHSPLMEPATGPLGEALARLRLGPVRRLMASTVTGAALAAGADLRRLLLDQLTQPVRFTEALGVVASGADLLIEVGPGTVLTGLSRQSITAPVVALEVGGRSLRGLLAASAALYCLGAHLDLLALFKGRALRPFDPGRERTFFANPCEHAPERSAETTKAVPATLSDREPMGSGPPECRPSHPEDGIELIRRLIAARAELPLESVTADSRVLGDLHLNSLSVAQIVADAAHARGLSPPAAPTEFAQATVRQLAEALETLEKVGADSRLGGTVAGVASWVRIFTTTLEPASPAPSPVAADRGWVLVAPPSHPLADLLRPAEGQGTDSDTVVACLPEQPDSEDSATVALLREASRPLIERGQGHFVLVQGERGAAAFARTLHLEFPRIATTVVTTPFSAPDPRVAAWVAREIATPSGHREVVYDHSGARRVPVLRHLWPQELGSCPGLGPQDVLVVSGGGKGIGAESALWLAQRTGTRVALLGRSSPDEDEELAANLARFDAAGAGYRYLRADVTDPGRVSAALREARHELGPLTAVLHAAGTNRPALLPELDEPAFRATLHPKVDGLRILLHSLDADPVRLLIAYGSIIARTGLRGEAHYGLANEWMGHVVERYRTAHPSCRTLMVDWSVWAGVGMGERLGTIDFLARNGVTPIPVETGLGVLETLTTRATPPAVLVTGRFGPPPTVRLAEPTLPLLRFVERVLVHYPGIELVVETELSHLHDPYLADHLIDGAPLLPGVLGLEAMAQVAVALSGASTEPVVENIEFLRPVVVPADRPQPIRIAALIGEDGRVAVTLRSAETAFEAEHFRASYRFDGGCEAVSEPARPEPGAAWMVSTNGWYGSLFFHGPRFRRVQGYRELHARRCVAEVDLNQHSSWFGRFLPDGLILGDPGALDACIHAVQACIPHERLLPVAVARLELLGWPPEGPLTVEAVERSEQGGEFVYDVEGREVGGRPCVRWVGLRLRRAGALAAPTWPSPLLGPYLERQLDARCPGTDIRVGVAQGPERLARSDKAIGRALNLPVTVRRGTDGRPWLDNGSAVSASHSECATIALAAHHRIGCDVQVVEPRSEAQWWRLLGPGRFDLAQALARESGASIDVSATAVWSAEESLLKAGRPVGEPITIRRCDREWVELAAGVLDVLLLLAQDGTGRPVVIGTATKAPSHVP